MCYLKYNELNKLNHVSKLLNYYYLLILGDACAYSFYERNPNITKYYFHIYSSEKKTCEGTNINNACSISTGKCFILLKLNYLFKFINFDLFTKQICGIMVVEIHPPYFESSYKIGNCGVWITS